MPLRIGKNEVVWTFVVAAIWNFSHDFTWKGTVTNFAGLYVAEKPPPIFISWPSILYSHDSTEDIEMFQYPEDLYRKLQSLRMWFRAVIDDVRKVSRIWFLSIYEKMYQLQVSKQEDS